MSDPKSMTTAVTETFAGWPLIALFGTGPDGTCHCPKGKNCSPKNAGKHPRWQRDPADPEKVITWPDLPPLTQAPASSNIGVRCGAEAGFWVLDVDLPGIDALGELIKDNGGDFPITRSHQTGSGAWHYFFTLPDDFDITTSPGRLPAGIDVRGNGGYVVLPPSRTGKGGYSVARDVPIAPAPGWLLDLLRPQAAPGPVAQATSAPAGEQSEYERVIIEGELQKLRAMSDARTADGVGYEGDPWDITTFNVACQLFELANADWSALTPDEVPVLVLADAPRDAGFDDKRVQEKIDSARRKVGDKARIDTRTGGSNNDWMSMIDNGAVETATPSQKAPSVTRRDPSDFFGKEGILVADLAHEILQAGPLRMGQNNRWWTYDDKGVWVEDKHVVINRTIDLLVNRYRGSHATNAEAVVRRFAPVLAIDTPDHRFINFENGMLEWETGLMKDHDPEYASSVQIPHAYEPEATCPRFDAFLESVMSPDYQRLVWEMIGYLLYSGNPLQVAFLLHGSGGDGKGTLLKVIQAMLGEHNVANQSLDSLNKDKFAPAMLLGKIANIAGDIDATFQESTANFKMLTGEDRLSAQNKNEPLFTFNNYAVPLFSANKIPGSADVSKGYLRRWVNIEFDRKFTGEPIRGYGDSLAATETAGVIVKGLQHLRELMARGTFTIEGEAERGKDEFAKKIDQVRQWVEEECLEVPERSTSRSDLYSRYVSWAAREGSSKISGREFYSRLEGIGFKQRKTNGVRVFDGIAMVSAQQQPHAGHDKFFTG